VALGRLGWRSERREMEMGRWGDKRPAEQGRWQYARTRQQHASEGEEKDKTARCTWLKLKVCMREVAGYGKVSRGGGGITAVVVAYGMIVRDKTMRCVWSEGRREIRYGVPAALEMESRTFSSLMKTKGERTRPSGAREKANNHRRIIRSGGVEDACMSHKTRASLSCSQSTRLRIRTTP